VCAGSAAAFPAGLGAGGRGTDTGGSIRQPSPLSGICGLKPTYGICSRYGLIAFASSLDQAGPFAQTAEDCALLLNAMAGHDLRDSTSLERPPEDYTRLIREARGENAAKPLAGLRIGTPVEYAHGNDPDVVAAIEAALRQMVALGAQMVEVSLPNVKL